MRIALVTHHYAPEIGAPQRRWGGLIPRFIAAGHEVTVLTPSPHYPSGRAGEVDPETAPGAITVGEHGETIYRVKFREHGPDLVSRTIDQGVVTYSVVTGPANGTAVVVGNNLRYTPNADFNGTDTLTWQACDPDGACDPATATYTVAAVDDSPVATGESLTTTEDVPVQGSVYVTDVDSAVFTFTVSTPPSSGTVALDALGGFMYTPDADTNGADGFVVTICDDTGLCDDATVTITVSAVNDAPTAAVTGGTTQTGTAGSEVTLTAAGTDPDADSLVHRWTQTAGAAVVLAQSGAQVRFTPAAAGAYAFAVETCDPAGLCDTATVSVNVAAAPVVAPVTSAPAAAAPAAAALAATGFNGGLLGLGALALVALGWALTGASRRAVSIRRH